MLSKKKQKHINYKDKVLELLNSSYIIQPNNYDLTKDDATAYLTKCFSLINKNYGQIVFILKSEFNYSSEELSNWSIDIHKFVSDNYVSLSKIDYYCIADGLCTLSDSSKVIFNSYIQSLNRYVDKLADICTNVFVKTKRNPEEKTIFVVHGHDEKLKESLSRALEKSGYNPILLSDKNDTGINLWEKFEKYANRCKKAIILMTKDDFVSKEQDDYYQARPNVFIEFGYFLNLLERKDIVVLVEKGCRMPSDINGVSYLEYSSCTKAFIGKVLDSLNI